MFFVPKLAENPQSVNMIRIPLRPLRTASLCLSALFHSHFPIQSVSYFTVIIHVHFFILSWIIWTNSQTPVLYFKTGVAVNKQAGYDEYVKTARYSYRDVCVCCAVQLSTWHQLHYMEINDHLVHTCRLKDVTSQLSICPEGHLITALMFDDRWVTGAKRYSEAVSSLAVHLKTGSSKITSLLTVTHRLARCFLVIWRFTQLLSWAHCS